MAEYIERKEIIKAIAAEACHCLTLNRPAEARGYIGAKELIERRKAAEVAEVRHGRWIDLDIENSTGPTFKCSECSHIHNPNRNDLDLERVELKPLYCDACGARMDKEADHD